MFNWDIHPDTQDTQADRHKLWPWHHECWQSDDMIMTLLISIIKLSSTLFFLSIVFSLSLFSSIEDDKKSTDRRPEDKINLWEQDCKEDRLAWPCLFVSLFACLSRLAMLSQSKCHVDSALLFYASLKRLCKQVKEERAQLWESLGSMCAGLILTTS